MTILRNKEKVHVSALVRIKIKLFNVKLKFPFTSLRVTLYNRATISMFIIYAAEEEKSGKSIFLCTTKTYRPFIGIMEEYFDVNFKLSPTCFSDFIGWLIQHSVLVGVGLM